MASRVKRESEKRKKLAERVAKYFKRQYGIEEDLVDYYALVDTNLTYQENIKNIKRILNKAEKVRRARDQLIKYVHEFVDYWREYGGRSYATDKGKRAKKVINLETARLKDIDNWLRNPNWYDIVGIDTPEKPKKKKRKKTPNEIKEFLKKVDWNKFCDIISTAGKPSKAKAHIILLNKYNIRLSQHPELWELIKKKCSTKKRRKKKA